MRESQCPYYQVSLLKPYAIFPENVCHSHQRLRVPVSINNFQYGAWNKPSSFSTDPKTSRSFAAMEGHSMRKDEA